MKNVKTLITGLLLLVASNCSYAGLMTLSETQEQTIDFQEFTFEWLIADWTAGTSAELTIELQADLGQTGELAFIDIESVTLGSFGEFGSGLSGWTSLISGGINEWRVLRTFTLTSANMASILADGIFSMTIAYTDDATVASGNGVALAYGKIGNIAPYAKVDVTYSNSAEVPEPTTLAIFALGLLGLASRRVKK